MKDYKVIFDYEPEPDLSWLEQWDTAEKYQGNEVLDPKTRQPMSFDDYQESYGNPDRHITLEMRKYRACSNHEHCSRCDGWELVHSLGNIDFMDFDNVFVGELEYDDPDEDTEMLNPYQHDLLKAA